MMSLHCFIKSYLSPASHSLFTKTLDWLTSRLIISTSKNHPPRFILRVRILFWGIRKRVLNDEKKSSHLRCLSYAIAFSRHSCDSPFSRSSNRFPWTLDGSREIKKIIKRREELQEYFANAMY
jgi:hypothetical protein